MGIKFLQKIIAQQSILTATRVYRRMLCSSIMFSRVVGSADDRMYVVP